MEDECSEGNSKTRKKNGVNSSSFLFLISKL